MESISGLANEAGGLEETDGGHNRGSREARWLKMFATFVARLGSLAGYLAAQGQMAAESICAWRKDSARCIWQPRGHYIDTTASRSHVH